jgi:hypothetical protein
MEPPVWVGLIEYQQGRHGVIIKRDPWAGAEQTHKPLDWKNDSTKPHCGSRRICTFGIDSRLKALFGASQEGRCSL